MSLYLSARQAWVLQSEIRNMSIECDRVGGINLSQGVCDTEVPAIVRRGAAEAMDRGINTYTHYAGLIELRRAIAAKQEKYSGLKADPEMEIIVSAGATGSFYCACLALLDPGDEVILFEPYYGYHLSTVRAVGLCGKFRTISLGRGRTVSKELLMSASSRGPGFSSCMKIPTTCASAICGA